MSLLSCLAQGPLDPLDLVQGRHRIREEQIEVTQHNRAIYEFLLFLRPRFHRSQALLVIDGDEDAGFVKT